MDGFLFTFEKPNVNAPGGRQTAEVIAIAETAEDARRLTGMYGLALVDDGAEVLERARALGLGDNGCKVI